MARQLRIEFPGAFYHITSRGNQKQDIFLSDDDRLYFLKCLGEAYSRYESLIHAYCIMNNHYHLFLETPRGNLSRVLHLVNTTYSIYFNKKWERCGHPLQGRFKAILVQAEHYARELVPYIHLNPVRSGITDSPEKYEWSNYREYVGLMDSRPWTRSSLVLNLFGSQREEARLRYAEYVTWRGGQRLPHPLSEAKSTGILGQPDFIHRMHQTRMPEVCPNAERELPELLKSKARPDMGTIVAAVEAVLGPKNRHAKKVAIFITHKNTDYTLQELGEFYRMSVSAISEACRKTRATLQFNLTLIQAIAEIEKRAFGEKGVKSTLYSKSV